MNELQNSVVSREECLSLLPSLNHLPKTFSETMNNLEREGKIRCHRNDEGTGRINAISEVRSGTPPAIRRVRKAYMPPPDLTPCRQDIKVCLHGDRCYLAENCKANVRPHD
jgi:hypothetical protein